MDEISNKKLVRRWETHLKPRIIPAFTERLGQSNDLNGETKIDRGWLTTETIMQFKFSNNSIIIKKKSNNRKMSIKVIIV